MGWYRPVFVSCHCLSVGLANKSAIRERRQKRVFQRQLPSFERRLLSSSCTTNIYTKKNERSEYKSTMHKLTHNNSSLFRYSLSLNAIVFRLVVGGIDTKTNRKLHRFFNSQLEWLLFWCSVDFKVLFGLRISSEQQATEDKSLWKLKISGQAHRYQEIMAPSMNAAWGVASIFHFK